MTTARGEVDEARTVPHDDQARPADGGAASPRGALAADGVSVHRLLVSALSTVANAVAIADTDGAIVWSNRACAALTGLEPEEALGRHLPSIGDPAEGPGGDTAAWAEVLAGRPWRGERRFGTGHGGEPRTVHQTLTPILDPDATVRYVVAVCDDAATRRPSAPRPSGRFPRCARWLRRSLSRSPVRCVGCGVG
ncbi:MAG: PAS domain-containing protein, partial [Egibacteraceae bacterium]